VKGNLQDSEEQQQPAPMVEITVGMPPTQPPAESPDTLASDTVIVSSPEPSPEENIEDMDMETLQDRQFTALENVQQLAVRLAKAQSYAWRITKRIKTMRESQGEQVPPATTNDTAMEMLD
jgi:hypothetical protein